jgi:hypothetical protein
LYHGAHEKKMIHFRNIQMRGGSGATVAGT